MTPEHNRKLQEARAAWEAVPGNTKLRSIAAAKTRTLSKRKRDSSLDNLTSEAIKQAVKKAEAELTRSGKKR